MGIRVVLWEATRRTMEGARNDSLRTAYGALVRMVRAEEQLQLSANEMVRTGLWCWADDETLIDLVRKTTDMTADLMLAPGFHDVRLLPYAIELLSLRRPDSHADPEAMKFAHMTYYEMTVLENEARRLAGDSHFYETDVRELAGDERVRAGKFMQYTAFPETRGRRGAP